MDQQTDAARAYAAARATGDADAVGQILDGVVARCDQPDSPARSEALTAAREIEAITAAAQPG